VEPGGWGMTQFIVYGLPRSRTFWLSRFLSFGQWHCGHDEIRHARSMDDIKSWFSQDFTGTVETAAAPWWRLVQNMQPGIKTVVVRRPVDEVVDSMARLGLRFDPTSVATNLRHLDRKLDQIERRVPNVLSVTFSDLMTESVCATVFEHCLGAPLNPEWYAVMVPLNIQMNFGACLRYYHANQPQLTKIASIAKHRILADMRPRTYDIEGMTIQQESFETFFQDGRHLFDEHLVLVGEEPGAYLNKNVPMMRHLYDAGVMQITTARSNGRMFGYLMALVNPSMESEAITTAIHTTFFASRDVPGLGMKLQRASLAALRKRGVDEAFWIAGTRGDGPRLDVLYRRLGAENFGQMFKLNMTVH